jgi:hypothetical protein
VVVVLVDDSVVVVVSDDEVDVDVVFPVLVRAVVVVASVADDVDSDDEDVLVEPLSEPLITCSSGPPCSPGGAFGIANGLVPRVDCCPPPDTTTMASTIAPSAAAIVPA